MIYIDIVNVGELSGAFEVSPTGELYLPRLREVQVEGFTMEEVRKKLQKSIQNTLKILRYL